MISAVAVSKTKVVLKAVTGDDYFRVNTDIPDSCLEHLGGGRFVVHAANLLDADYIKNALAEFDKQLQLPL